MDKYSVLDLWGEYLGLAKIYLKFNEKKKAVNMLNKMIEDISQNDVINKANRINCIWCFNEIEMPKGNKGMKMNFYENILGILKDSVFDSVKEDGDFKNVVNKLNSLKERGVLRG